MPWDSTTIRKHNHSLKGAAADHAARQANAVLKASGDEGMALAVANKWAKKHKRALGGPAPTVPTYQTGAVNVNPQGFVPVPQPGDYNLDLNTGATTGGTRSAIQNLAQRGLPIKDPNAPQPAPTPAPTTPPPLAYGSPEWWNAVAAMQGGSGLGGGSEGGGGGGYAGGGGLAGGGANDTSPWWTRRESSGETSKGFSGGLIQGPTGGRADKVSMNLPPHSHVIPALAVAGMGGGNTEAGAAHMNNVLSTGPFGAAMPKVHSGPGPRSLGTLPHPQKLANGGPAEGHHETMVSHGEYVVTPEEVLAIGKGDYNAGHDWLDRLIKHIHKEVGKQATHAPPPVKER